MGRNEAVQVELDLNWVKFHGETFVKQLDEDRMKGQLKRVYEVLSDGLSHTVSSLAYYAKCSERVIRSRVSDLRVYYGYDISCKRIGQAVFCYQLVRKLTPEEFEQEQIERMAKSRGTYGREDLWTEYLRTIFAYANSRSGEDKVKMMHAAHRWQENFIHQIWESKNAG